MINGKAGVPLKTAWMTVVDWWGGIEGRTMLCLLEKHKGTSKTQAFFVRARKPRAENRSVWANT